MAPTYRWGVGLSLILTGESYSRSGSASWAARNQQQQLQHQQQLQQWQGQHHCRAHLSASMCSPAAAAEVMAMSTLEAVAIADAIDDGDDDNKESKGKDKAVKKERKPAKEKPSKDPRDRSGFIFKDEFGDYDVPFIDVPMWYRLQVRRRSEKTLCDYFLHLRDTDPKWKGVISEAFYPVQDYVTMGKKSLSNKPRPMTPGVIYLKTKMDPDIADDIELVKGIYGLVKSANRLVLPITEEEGKMLESLLEKAMNANTLDPQFAELKRDEYVEIISGPWAGRYGILQGVRLGKLEVCLRSNYKDDFDTFDLHEVRYLANPPEQKVSDMSAREAVLSLMAKDKHNPTIKALKQAGLLEDILYPDGQYTAPRRDSDETLGREGGRSLRSIAKDKKVPEKKASSAGWSEWGDSPAPDAGAESEEEEGFSPTAWNAQLSRAGLSSVGDEAPRKWAPKSRTTEQEEAPYARGSWGSDGDGVDSVAPRKWVPKSRPGQETGFDDTIDDLMADFSAQGDNDDDADDDPEMAAISGRGAAAAAAAAAGKGEGLVTTSDGRRGWWPKGQEPRASSPPRNERRGRDRADDSYGSAYGYGGGGGGGRNDGGGWFDGANDGFEYNSYGAGGSRPSSDRADSEQVLNDLLKDLDIGGGGASIAGGSNLFDFSDDDDDDGYDGGRAADSRPSRGGGDRGFSPRGGAARGQRGGSVPKMEDFATFQEYLDALVNHDKVGATSGGGGAKKLQPSSGRGAGRDADTLDDDIVDLLGGGDGFGDSDNFGGGGGGGSRSRSRNNAGSEQPPPRERRAREQPATAAVSVTAMPALDADLDSFMDALEKSNVVGGATKARAKSAANTAAPSAPPAAATASSAAAEAVDYGKLTVPALKSLLKERGQTVGGTKPELIARLRGI